MPFTPPGPWELMIILLIVVVIFGAGKLAGVGGAIGKSVREFRQATRDEAAAAAEKEKADAAAVTTSASATSTTAPAPPAPVAAPTEKVCASCGTKNPPSQAFCGQCGMRLAETPEHAKVS